MSDSILQNKWTNPETSDLLLYIKSPNLEIKREKLKEKGKKRQTFWLKSLEQRGEAATEIDECLRLQEEAHAIIYINKYMNQNS